MCLKKLPRNNTKLNYLVISQVIVTSLSHIIMANAIDTNGGLIDQPMADETNRLITYINCPASTQILATRMARQGLYYSGEGDRVICYRCNGVLEGWRPGDKPEEVHRRHFPTCELSTNNTNNRNTPLVNINRFDIHQNIQHGHVPNEPVHRQNRMRPADALAEPDINSFGSPSLITHNARDSITPRDPNRPIGGVNVSASRGSGIDCTGSEIPGHVNNIRQPVATSNRGIVTSRPSYPAMNTVSNRLATYNQWIYHQQPHTLAEAGFFHTDFVDSVKCFHCGGGLRDWTPEDDPWTEHARWYPQCEFVRQSKGEDFVRQVCQRFGLAYPLTSRPRHVPLSTTFGRDEEASREAASPSSLGIHMSSGNVADLGRSVYSVESREVSARLDTPMAQAMLMLPGVTRQAVSAVMESQLRTGGDNFPSMERLRDLVYDMQLQIEAGNVPQQQQQQQQQQQTHTPRGGSVTQTGEGSAREDVAAVGAGAEVAALGLGEDEEVKSLAEQNKQMRDARTCKICMDKEVNTVFLPCGHLVACSSCAPALRNCPICRAVIRGTVRTYLS